MNAKLFYSSAFETNFSNQGVLQLPTIQIKELD